MPRILWPVFFRTQCRLIPISPIWCKLMIYYITLTNCHCIQMCTNYTYFPTSLFTSMIFFWSDSSCICTWFRTFVAADDSDFCVVLVFFTGENDLLTASSASTTTAESTWTYDSLDTVLHYKPIFNQYINQNSFAINCILTFWSKIASVHLKNSKMSSLVPSCR